MQWSRVVWNEIKLPFCLDIKRLVYMLCPQTREEETEGPWME